MNKEEDSKEGNEDEEVVSSDNSENSMIIKLIST